MNAPPQKLTDGEPSVTWKRIILKLGGVARQDRRRLQRLRGLRRGVPEDDLVRRVGRVDRRRVRHRDAVEALRQLVPAQGGHRELQAEVRRRGVGRDGGRAGSARGDDVFLFWESSRVGERGRARRAAPRRVATARASRSASRRSLFSRRRGRRRRNHHKPAARTATRGGPPPPARARAKRSRGRCRSAACCCRCCSRCSTCSCCASRGKLVARGRGAYGLFAIYLNDEMSYVKEERWRFPLGCSRAARVVDLRTTQRGEAVFSPRLRPLRRDIICNEAAPWWFFPEAAPAATIYHM